MIDIKDITAMIPPRAPENFCLAPFQSIRQNAHGRNSPCAFGAGEWDHGHLSPQQRWNSPELNDLRVRFLQGQKPSECHRCWREEAAGKLSLRQRQWQYYPNDYDEFIRSGQWIQGPKTAVLKTSNVCNLACRSCGPWDSNSFAPEGLHYTKTYATKIINQGVLVDGNRFTPRLGSKHLDTLPYVDIADNLEKVDFFGGEPFLNTSHVKLLEALIQQGRSQHITLFYSTNCTTKPTPRLQQAWQNFARIEISVSIDGTGKLFEYLRWPAKWSQASAVLDFLLDLQCRTNNQVWIMAGVTASILNVFDIDDITNYLQNQVNSVYINMVNEPKYLSIATAPDSVKTKITQHIKNPEILGYLSVDQFDPMTWRQFIVWMKRQDLYRNQSIKNHCGLLYEIIKSDWDSIVSLDENSLNFLNS